MAGITIEIAPPDDPHWDKAWPVALATGEYLSKVLGVPVTVSDNCGSAHDFQPESG
ncbi:hypothetical protein ACH5AO_21220 [Streptomyces sp. NPDC018964]|uniref:hypothetical protein n=1 Tax=unclassified Streptomyces TaxID=2593676 RepID=UPI000AC8A0B0|nr:hypothetical protein [Streptomyces sp. NRRL S-37]